MRDQEIKGQSFKIRMNESDWASSSAVDAFAHPLLSYTESLDLDMLSADEFDMRISQRMNKYQKSFMYTYIAKGVIDNGGFTYFYENSARSKQSAYFATAFDVIGLPGVASIVRESESLKLSYDEEKADRLDDRFYEETSGYWDHIRAFIEENWAHFVV